MIAVPGAGKIFVEYADVGGADAAQRALAGRKFGGNVVIASYLSEDKYSVRDFS